MKYIIETKEPTYFDIILQNDLFGKYMNEEALKGLSDIQLGYFVALVARLGLVASDYLLKRIDDTVLEDKIEDLLDSEVFASHTDSMNYKFLKELGFDVPPKEISPLEEVATEISSGMMKRKMEFCTSKNRYVCLQNDLARILSSRILIVNNESKDSYLGFNGQIYEKITNGVIEKVCREVINEIDPNAWCNNLEREFLKAYIHEIPTTEQLKSGKSTMAFQNLLFDLDTGKAMDFSPEYYITSQVSYNYDKLAKCDKFLEFLKEIFSGNMEVVNFIQQLMGYLLLYDRSIPYIYIFTSSGRSGKSVLTSIFTKMLGSKKVSHTQLARLDQNFGLQSLEGTQLNISSENEGEINTEILKAISGDDIIEVERKYKDPEALDLGTRLVISSNQNLKFNDESDAIHERLLFIPFDHKFLADPEEARKQGCKVADPQLANKLEKELPGIFNFAYEGLEQLRANGMKFDIPKICKEKRKEFQNYNSPIKVFVDEYIELDDKSAVSRTELREAFEIWQEEYSQCVKINTSQVAAQILDYIKESNPTVSLIDKKFSNSRVTQGIRLKDIT